MKHYGKTKVEVTEGPGYFKATVFVGGHSATASHHLKDAAIGFAFELLGRVIVNAALAAEVARHD